MIFSGFKITRRLFWKMLQAKDATVNTIFKMQHQGYLKASKAGAAKTTHLIVFLITDITNRNYYFQLLPGLAPISNTSWCPLIICWWLMKGVISNLPSSVAR